MRVVWLVVGLLCVAVGGIGIVVPGLPTTIFFIIAAWCFSRSNERLERWILGLPKIGPLVADHRAGLGMPRRAKVWAITMIVVGVGLSAVFFIDSPLVRLIVVAVGLVGVWYVGLGVPTKKRADAR